MEACVVGLNCDFAGWALVELGVDFDEATFEVDSIPVLLDGLGLGGCVFFASVLDLFCSVLVLLTSLLTGTFDFGGVASDFPTGVCDLDSSFALPGSPLDFEASVLVFAVASGFGFVASLLVFVLLF